MVEMVGPWMPAHGVAANEMLIYSEIAQRLGNYQHKMGFQTAEVSTDFPDGWTWSGVAPRNANGLYPETFPSVAWTNKKLWVRPGLQCSASSVNGEAQVALQASIVGRSKIVSARTIQLNPDLNATTVGVHPITGAFPATGLTEVMVACILSGVDGTVTYQPMVRFFNRLDEAPAWSLLFPAGTPGVPRSVSANDRFNFGSRSVTPGANLWAQVGIEVTTAPKATIQSIVSAKY